MPDSLFAPLAEEDVKKFKAEGTVAAPERPVAESLFAPLKPDSAEEIVRRAHFAGRDSKDTSEELKKAGYKPSADFEKRFEQERALAAERERQGSGVGTFEQAARNMIPFGSALLGSRRESANAEATKRFGEGKATPEDIQTIATYQRRQDADREINSTLGGQLLNVVGQAPAILGETAAAGKVLGLAGRAAGLGQVAPPLAAAVNPSLGRAAINYAGKQALMTPLVPSMYVHAANQKNVEEGRDPNDVRGYAPAIGLGYANMLVLGSLQKFGNTGGLAQQVAQKAAIGVGEQAAVDVGTGATDEFLNKSYKMGTRYGVLGDVARGEAGKGLSQATVQAFTFGYFAALHGKQSQPIIDAYKGVIDANASAGLSPEASAKVAGSVTSTLTTALKGRLARASNDAFEAGREFTQGDARNLFANVDAATKGMTGDQRAAVQNYIEKLVNVFPEKRGRTETPKDVTVREPDVVHGDEGPVPEPADRSNADQVSLTRGEPVPPGDRLQSGVRAEPETPGEVHPVDRLDPADRAALAKQLGLKNEKALKTGPNAGFVRAFAEKVLAEKAKAPETASTSPPVAEVAPERPNTQPEPIAQPERSQGPENALLHVPDYKTPGSNLSAARKLLLGSFAGKWFSKGRAQNEGYFTDGKFQVEFAHHKLGDESKGDFVENRVKEVGVGSQTPMYLHPALTAVRYRGKAEGAEFQEMQLLVKDVNDERQKAGLDPVTLESTERRKAQSEDHPGRRESDKPKVTVAEKVAPDRVAPDTRTTSAAIPPKVTAERRSAPRTLARPDLLSQTTEYERRQDAGDETRDTRTPYEQVPEVVRKRLEGVLPVLAAAGLNAETYKENIRRMYVAGGLDAATALVERYQADYGPLWLVEKINQRSEAELAKADREETDARGAVADLIAAERDTLARRRLRERASAVQAEADRTADQAVNGRRAEKAPQPGEPRQAPGEAVAAEPEDTLRPYRTRERTLRKEQSYEGMTADEAAGQKGYDRLRNKFVDRLFDAAEKATDPQVKDALEAVIHNNSFGLQAIAGGWKSVSGGRSAKAYGEHQFRQQAAEAIEAGIRALDRAGRSDAAEQLRPLLEGFAEKGAKKAPPRVKTIVDDVIEAGGIRRDSSIEAGLTANEHPHLGRPGVFTTNKRAHSLDTMAEKLGMSADELSNALKEGKRPSREIDNTAVHDAALAEHERKVEQSGPPAEEWVPSDEEIPYSRGDRSRGEKPSPDGKVGPFEIIAAQDKIFGVKNYVESGVPGVPGDVNAAARLRERATVTGKRAAGNEEINLEEHAHHLQREFKLPIDPAAYPPEVARGIQEFFADRAEAYGEKAGGPPTRLGMQEGFADWLISRSRGDLKDLSPRQEIANEFLERWAKTNGLTGKFDQVKELYARRNDSAAANVSATGKPVEVSLTRGEAAVEFVNKAEEVIDNDLAAARRFANDAEAKGHKFAVGERPDVVLSQLMHADKARAAEFERNGVHTYVDGRKVVIGLPFEKIIEGGKDEWLKPGENGEASRAGVYAIARHLLGEESRGRTDIVSKDQLEAFRKTFEEMRRDVEFATWAEGYADRLTKGGFNASRRALAAKDVHFLSPGEVDVWEEKRPDYIPTERVQQAGWQNRGAWKRGETPKKITGERSGSGEQIIDPLITYKNRLRVTSAVMGEQLKRIAVEKVLKLPGMGGWGVSTGEVVQTELGKLRSEKLAELGFEGDALKKMLGDMGLARAEEYFTTKPWPTDGTKPTWGLKNADGKLVNYRIGDKALYDLITGQQVEANALASWLKKTGEFYPVKLMTQAVKFGATSASLGFQARNIPRDIYTFWQNTIDRTTVKTLPDAYARAFVYAWHQLLGHFGKSGSTDVLFRRFEQDRGTGTREFEFDKNNLASAYGDQSGKTIKAAHTVWGILKDVLNVAGAGELAPRFAEWKTRLQQTTGKTEEQLTKELEDAEKAASEGRNVPDPIPLGVALDAMNAAAEVTVNFNRLGTVTRQMNKITPFFGPAIAGLSKEIRNWKDNPKGAAFALSGLLAARLMHWIMFSDDDWYKELNANDRYNNFVVPTPAGLRRLPAPRDLGVAGGGFLTTVLDAAAGKNPDLKGYLKQSLGAILPPAPVPPAAKTGYEIATNENWMGSPIVPKREESASTIDKWINHRLGYAADQMTGGLVSERKVPKEAKDLIPYSEVRNARRTVDEFFDRFDELEQGHQKADRSGIIYENQAEYARMKTAQKQIVDASRAIRGERLVDGKVKKGEEPSEEKKSELRQKQLEVAKRALGR